MRKIRFKSLAFLLFVSLIVTLLVCDEQPPTPIAVVTQTVTDRPITTPTQTPTATHTATQTPSPPPIATDTQTPTPTHISTPTITPFPTLRRVPFHIATIMPFPTVTPNYISPEPKQVFLSLSYSLGDGIEMPYYINISGGRQFFIYADGQIVIDGTEIARFRDDVASYRIGRYAWSPDSKQLAVIKYHEDQRANTIQIIDLENGFTRRDVVTFGFISSIDWIRRSNRSVLLFSAEEPNSGLFWQNGSSSSLRYDHEIYTFDLETNILTQITYTNQVENAVDW